MPMHLKNHDFVKIMDWVTQGIRNIRVAGLSGASRALFLSLLIMETDRPWLILLPQAKDAVRFYRELLFFLPDSCVNADSEEKRLYDFPPYDISPLTGLSPHSDVVSRRLQALYTLTSDPKPVVVTSIESILSKVLPKASIIKAVEYLEPGEEVERDELLRRLRINGYMRTSLVEEMGDFSVRGGIIDIFSPLYSKPARLEFWGDRLESIRYFDPLSQRSFKHLKEMILLPANEILWEKENIKRSRSMGRLPGLIKDGGGFPGQEAWLNHFYSRLDTLFDYFPENGLLTLIDPLQIQKEADRFTEKSHSDMVKYRREAEERESPFPETEGLLISPERVRQLVEKYQCIEFTELAIEKSKASDMSLQIQEAPTANDGLDIQFAGKGRVSLAPLGEKIAGWLDLGGGVVLVCRTEQQAYRLKEILRNYRIEVDEIVSDWADVRAKKGLSICLGRLSRGFAWQSIGLYVVSEDEIFGPKRARARTVSSSGDKGLNWTSFSQLKQGDLLVHPDHGVGLYGDLFKMEIEGKVNDFIIIEYMDNDRLYIPADRISLLQKYIGVDDKNPKLDRLGGRSWNLARQKAKKSIREIAKQIVEVSALRKYRKGYAFSRPDNYFREFEAAFEHEETPDQIKAIDDVLSDMESQRPMDRLVCGDVGFGKTEVAIRAAFKAVMDGKQAALLVPTTVLAEQHYDTFFKRMEPYQVKVAVLSRFKTAAEQKKIIAETRSGKIDVLIGTHRIIQKDVGFKSLGLLIIDEEHRFGVKQKETLKKYRALVDVLALTATPIPRTLHLSLMVVWDLIIIETPPEERLAIRTYLTTYDESKIKRAIEFELDRGGQTFFVHNRVQTIENIAAGLKPLVPGARFAIAHGQMKERKLEETMTRFLKKEIDVLICTTIIESGLDIPSANTIIINNADRFGLAQIYQLRGRVGRSKENAYAYLIVSGDSGMTRDAEKRLKALMDFSQLGAGFHLAMHDLKIRGGGNILGFQQAGNISAIGYDLYLKMVEQTIAELKGEEWQDEINPEINVSLSAYLPGDYVSDIDVRLNLYRRLSGLKEEEDLKAITEEMQDRFGSTPPEVTNLLSIMLVRLMLKKIRVSKLDVNKNSVIFSFSPDTNISPEKMIELAGSEPARYQFLSDNKLKVRLTGQSSLEALLEIKSIIEKLLM